MIVNTMYSYNKERNLEEMNQGLFDQLDLDLYEEFLTLKAENDNFDGLELDDNLIFSVKFKLLTFLNEFEKKFDSKFTKDFFILVNKIRGTISYWIKKMREDRKPSIALKVPLPLFTDNFLKKR